MIASVHSFTQSDIGYFFLALLFVSTVVSFTLLYTRWPMLEAEVQLESLLSRESAFLFNNLALVGIAFSVLWGTLFPIISEAVRGTKITVGPLVLQSGQRAARALPAAADRDRSADRVAQGVRVQPAASVHRARARRRGGWRRAGASPGCASSTRWCALALAGFVMGTVAQEFYRGIRARMALHGGVGRWRSVISCRGIAGGTAGTSCMSGS